MIYPPSRLAAMAAVLLVMMAADASLIQAQGLDKVRHRNGLESGKITKMTALAVTLTKSGVETKLPVEEIQTITFAGEPDGLASARRFCKAERYEDALEKLRGINSKLVSRVEIQQEIDFLTVLSQTRLALSGRGRVSQSQKAVTKFLSKHGKSYHVPDAIELLGDTLMASEDYEGARQQYAKLGKAPAPYFKARSAFLTGRSYQAEGKHQESVAAFDDALRAASRDVIAKSQQLEATLYRAVSQAALGEVEASTAAVRKIIAEAEPENVKIMAKAYNALGDCYLQAKENKAALHAFLHVDLLFSAAAEEHAKALHELTKLWDAVGKSERVKDAQARLEEKYPGSPWAKR